MANNEDKKKELEEILKLIEKINKAELNIDLDISNLNAAQLSIGKIGEMYKKIEESVGNTSTLDAEVFQAQGDMLIQLERVLDIKRQMGETSEEEISALEDQISLLNKKLEIASKDEKNARNLLDTTLKLNEANQTIIGRFGEINKLRNLRLPQEELLEKRQQAIAVAVQQTLDAVKAMGVAIVEVALELEKSVRDLMRVGNLTFEEAKNQLLDFSATAASAGISIQAGAEAVTELKTNFSGFTTLTKNERDALRDFTAVMDRIGISGQTQAKLLDTTTKSLGMSVTQTKSFVSSLKGFADQAGLTLQQLDKNLAGSMENISMFGDNALKVFKEMSLASKQLGIDMQKLFQITEGFTEFESAASAAGQLNAILGGDFINSVELMSASLENPIDALAILKRGFDQSGMSFNDLDGGMKRVIASSMGMSVIEAGKFLSQDLNTATAAMREQAKTQEELNKVSSRFADLGDKMQKMLLALYPALEPILDGIEYASELLTDLSEWLAENAGKGTKLGAVLKFLTIGFTVLAGAIGFITVVLLPLLATITAGIKIFSLARGAKDQDTAAANRNAAAQMRLTNAARRMNLMAGAAMKRMIGLGVAAGALLLGFGAAAAGVGYFAEKFGNLTYGKMAAVAVGIGLLGIGLVAFIGAIAAITSGPQAVVVALAVGVLLGIGAALFLIGEGIERAGKGMEKMDEALPGLLFNLTKLDDIDFENLTKLSDIFKGMAESVGKINQNMSFLDKVKNVQSMTAATIPSNVVTMEFQAKESDSTTTVLDADGNKLEVNVKIDTPVYINNRELFRIMEEFNQTLLTSARTK